MTSERDLYRRFKRVQSWRDEEGNRQMTAAHVRKLAKRAARARSAHMRRALTRRRPSLFTAEYFDAMASLATMLESGDRTLGQVATYDLGVMPGIDALVRGLPSLVGAADEIRTAAERVDAMRAEMLAASARRT